jgi:hypothetical protein
MTLEFAAATDRAIQDRIRAKNAEIDEQTRHRCPTPHAYSHLELLHGVHHEP